MSGSKIFAHNLPWNWETRDIEDQFNEVGKVTDVHLLKKDDGSSRGMAIVTFKEEEDARAAVKEISGKRIDGRMITCREDRGVGYVHPDTARRDDRKGGGGRDRDESRGRGGDRRGGGRRGDSRGRRRDSRRRR